MQLTRSYTTDHKVLSDGSVTFECSRDEAEWPWLALPAQHPLVIQTQNFWTSVGATAALGTRDDSKWSALTWTDWALGELDAGQAARGVFALSGEEGELAFTTQLFDAQDQLIARIGGKGVVFRTRNFEKWREGAKTSAKQDAPGPAQFDYAPRDSLGLTEREPPLIGTLVEGPDGPMTKALVTKENGLMPGHPFFSGSGDHVNAPHLSELARQTVSLLCDGAAIQITRGEMDMHRYIELGTEISIAIEEQQNETAVLRVSQLERSCAVLTMTWAKI